MSIADIKQHFGEHVKCSIQSTRQGSIFYTIIDEPFHIYIEDFGDEIISSIFKNKELIASGVEAKTEAEIIKEIKDLINEPNS
jgi:hypothetical protein